MAAPSAASIGPTAPRTKPMAVLLPGLFRTGINSMATALRILGHCPVWHGYEMAVSSNFQSQHRLKLLNKNYKHQQLVTGADFEPILNGYVAVSDFLCCVFAEELMDAYPEAKIVLVERKQEAWYRSFTTVMLDVHFAWPCLFFVEYLEWAVPNKNLGVMHLGFLDFF